MRQEALKTVHNLAKNDPRVLFIGSDLGAGTLEAMRNELPQQFFMEGISEQYLIGFAAGLAQEGFIPYVNTIGTFFVRRAYEQISIDLGLHCLPVRLLSSGGGMVYAPLGPTHTAIEDISLMLSVPNMKVFAPADAHEMKMLLEASIDDRDPYFIRFGKGGEKIVTQEYNIFDFQPKIFGNLESKTLLFTTGILLQHCLEAQEVLESLGIKCAVVHFPYLNNLNLSKFYSLIKERTIILCVEEHVPRGGLYTQILHELAVLRKPTINIYHKSLPKEFPHNYGSQAEHLVANGLTGPKIVAYLQELYKKNGV